MGKKLHWSTLQHLTELIHVCPGNGKFTILSTHSCHRLPQSRFARPDAAGKPPPCSNHVQSLQDSLMLLIANSLAIPGT